MTLMEIAQVLREGFHSKVGFWMLKIFYLTDKECL